MVQWRNSTFPHLASQRQVEIETSSIRSPQWPRWYVSQSPVSAMCQSLPRVNNIAALHSDTPQQIGLPEHALLQNLQKKFSLSNSRETLVSKQWTAHDTDIARQPVGSQPISTHRLVLNCVHSFSELRHIGLCTGNRSSGSQSHHALVNEQRKHRNNQGLCWYACGNKYKMVVSSGNTIPILHNSGW